MSDAISNLGGGGLSTPFLSNLANSVDYASGCLISLFGGPLINKLGIRWACVIASIGMPLGPSGYYQSARYGTDWYLLLSKACDILTTIEVGGNCVLTERLVDRWWHHRWILIRWRNHCYAFISASK